ncbi:MAG: 2-hydroxyacyl-CoA dehydratase subunit D [Lachnospiraceae bacterium]
MTEIKTLLSRFEEIASNPDDRLNSYVKEGKKVIGCFPYYVPEELVQAADMVPFGIWGAEGTVSAAKEYFATFYCTIAQMNLEMGLTGKLKGLSGVIVPSLCDTLRPLSQNFRVAVPDIPFIFIAHPQNRQKDFGVKYTREIFDQVKHKLEEIAGQKITDEKIQDAIKIYNQSRAVRRTFIRLAGAHPEAVTPIERSAVLKSAFFITKAEHTAMLEELNQMLEELPPSDWNGTKIFTSGILADNKNLLQIFEEHNLAVAADDVAAESRGIRIDVPVHDDPLQALALQFGEQDHDTLLYDPQLNKRPKYITEQIKQSGAKGIIILMMQFCDPEEMEYPSLKKELDEQGIPHIIIGVDQQMKDYAQARTQIQAFADVIMA